RLEEEDELDRSLRPKRLQDFVGQPSLKEQLAISIEATIARGDDPRHLARDGLLGLGFSSAEADQLLDGAPGDSAEALIAHALRESRR
ncbi:MAG: holliday junction helicase RuvA, partial [Thermoleophilaceae bacterium]|nr:holliday junction helicase RuvA [Thermoleophilaceae bacterium]